MKISVINRPISFIASLFILFNTHFAITVHGAVLSMENAAKLKSELQQSASYYSSNNNILLDKDGYAAYEVFINNNNELDLKDCKNTTFTPSSSQTPERTSETCESLKTPDDKLPKDAYLFCNDKKDYLIALYKDKQSNNIRLVKRSKNTKELKTLAEIKGNYLTDISKPPITYPNFPVFVVTENTLTTAKQGTTIIVVSETDGRITIYNHPFSLQALPYDRFGCVYFVGEDNNVYELSSRRNNFPSPLYPNPTWKNDTGLDIIEIGLDRDHGFIKLREYGKDIYRFFTNDFTRELTIEKDIIKFRYLSDVRPSTSDTKTSDYENKDEKIGTVALVTKSRPHLPLITFLIRWYQENNEKENSEIRFIDKAGELSDKEAEKLTKFFNLTGDLLNTFKSLLDLENKTMNVTDLKAHDVTDKVYALDLLLSDNKNLTQTKVQIKVLQDFADYNDVEFTEPYSQTMISPKDGTKIPVNIWPAKNASSSNSKPMIVYVHGGPNAYVDVTSIGMYATIQYLSQQGFWVVCPETQSVSLCSLKILGHRDP